MLADSGGGVEAEAAGFRPGEWIDVRVIATARVPIITITIGGFPFLADDEYQALPPPPPPPPP
eukprot:SAG22_NODE_11046_length_503_cov_1.071782_1_plen_62_part_01